MPNRPMHPDIADRYDVKETIGSGGFAKVKVGRHKLTGMQVAIKIMDKAALGDDLPRAYLEIRTLKELRHQHICQLYEVIETKERLYLIIEFAPGGELFDYIVAQDRLKEQEARKFFRQVISAVAYVHSKGYAHRDLKPENLLLDEHQNIKLIDFGLVAHPSSLDMPLATCCGSPAYAAPELIQARPYLGTEADVWSLGILLYALLCGFLPFDDDNTAVLYSLIKRGKYDIPNWLSQLSVRFLAELIVLDPKRRLSIGGVVLHSWMNRGYDKPLDHVSIYEGEECDQDVVREMCRGYGRSEESVVAELKLWKYDAFTSTYFLLHKMKRTGKKPTLKLQPPQNTISVSSPLRSPGTPTGSPLPRFRLQSMDDGNNMYFSTESLPGSDCEEPPRSPAVVRRTAASESTEQRRPSSSIEPSSKTPVNLFLQKHGGGGGRGAGIRSHSVDESLDKSAASAPLGSDFLSGDDDAFRPGTGGFLAPAISQRHRAASVDERLNQLSLGNGPHGRAAATLPTGVTGPSSALAALATPSRSRKHGTTMTQPQGGGLEKGGFRGSFNRIVANVRDSLGSSSKGGPRKVKALYNVQTTSTKPPEEVLAELQRVVMEEQILFRVKGYLIRCKTLGKDGKVNLSFDMEVCQLPRMDMIGISRKRIKGDTWLYKNTCERILKAAHL